MEKELKTDDFQPNNFDIKALEKKGWYQNGKITKEFIEIYKAYYSFLAKYLDKILNISEMDKILKESKFHLKEVEEQDKDIYQSFSSFSYFYLRNTLYIERLDELELQQLKKKIDSKDEILDYDTEMMIKQSYEKVITTTNVENVTFINYGPYSSRQYYAQNNAIVLGVRYDPEYNASENNPDYSDDAWDENNDRQIYLVKAVIDTMNEEAENKLNVPVKVIEYNEDSVKKKDTNSLDLKSRRII